MPLNRVSIVLASVALSATAVGLSSHAEAADGNVTYLSTMGPSDRPMVLAASDRGIVLIGQDNQVFRAFHHEQTAREGVSQPFLWVEDIDGDRQDEIVGAGSPSFVIESNGDPQWGVLDGCTQYFIGDFIDDRNTEVFCRGANTMRVWSHDGQPWYEWSGRGYSIGDCYADDFDSDRKMEVACALTNGNHLQFDIEYDSPEERDGAAPEVVNQGGINTRRVAQQASGERTVTMGAREVSLGFSGGAIQITDEGAPIASIAVTASAIHSAISADLDNDGSAELYVGGVDEVYVINGEGALIATVPANPSAMRRDARVELGSATANGLENSDREAVSGVVTAAMDDLRQCYASRMGADQFTRVGRMLYQLSVDGSGRVSDSRKLHSDLASDALERCVVDELEDLRFSPATEGSGTVSVTLQFDFVDRP